MVDAAQARVRGKFGVDVEKHRHVHLLACGRHSNKAGLVQNTALCSCAQQ